jgi:Spy/CpxP family protein refolding chaperone
VFVLALVLGASFITAAQAQERSRSGSARGFSSRSLVGLLRSEQVQKEMKLNEEQVAKVNKVVEAITTEMREQYSALREIEDRQKRTEKMAELRDEFDGKVREQLRDVVPREQMMRLYQIRLQVRAVVESLANTYVARRLEITDDQKEKLAQIDKDMQSARSELYASMRDVSSEQRDKMYEKLRQIGSEADEKALGVLTAEQREAFEEMKGEKTELQMRRS